MYEGAGGLLRPTAPIFVDHTIVEPRRSGPLSGLTFAVKDLIDVAGTRTGCGNPSWMAEQVPASASAAAVTALLDAGARLIGKTMTDEFAYSLSGVNDHYGITANPIDVARTAGGSSSGSAVAVGLGATHFALGTDTGGSVRVPASYCGIVGFRPTHGRVSTAGVMPLAPSFDTIGWFARTAATALLVGRSLLAPGPATPIQRMIWIDNVAEVIEPRVATRWRGAAQDLAHRFGLQFARRSLPGPSLHHWATGFRTIQAAEAWATYAPWLDAHPGAVSPTIRARFAQGAAVDPDTLAAAHAEREDLVHQLRQIHRDDDVLIVPSASGAAPRLDTLTGHQGDEIRASTLALTCLGSMAAAPVLSLPTCIDDGLPVGLSLIGPPGADMAVLELAARHDHSPACHDRSPGPRR